jgi:flagellar motility protein MotE (MotC chaperone)
MKPLFSFRTLLLFLAISGGAKFVVPMLETINNEGPGQKQRPFTLVNAGYASEAADDNEAEIEPQQCEKPEEILLAINNERDLLSTQKAKLDERKAAVSLAEEKLKQETDRLSSLKKDLEGLLMRVEQAKSDDLKRLVSIYSGMKPKEAATIMNTLDMEVTVMVLGQMKERDAAPIFAKLNVVRSQAISKIILERSKLPGDQKLNGIALQ